MLRATSNEYFNRELIMPLLIAGHHIYVRKIEPLVDWDGNTTQTTRTGGVCFAIFKIDSDGGKYDSNGDGTYSGFYKTWLKQGETSQVWCERDIASGSASLSHDDIGSGRVPTTSDLETGILDAVATGSPTLAEVEIRFYDTASGGNLLATDTLFLSAERE